MNQKSVISSLIFKFTERVAAKILGLVIGIVLARLLEPEAFGMIAIVSVFMNLAQTFIQSGWTTALVQNSSTEEDDYSIVLLLSMATAVGLMALLYVLAPLIAVWYEEPALIWPLRIMSLSLLLGAFNAIQTARMQRQMRFRPMMYCNLIATVLSGALGIVAAFMGAGLWALVIYNMANTLIALVCMLVADNWRPKWIFNLKRAGVFWDYGWKMLVSGLLCSIYNDIRSLIIGKRFSTEALAYYNRGEQFPGVIATTLDNAVQSVMLPVMSAEQDDLERLSNILLKALSLSLFVVAPMMLGLAAVADTLIPLLLTEKWMASVPFMVVFCLSNLTVPVMMTNLSVIKSMGRSDVYMKTEMVRRVAMLIVLLITVLFFDSVMVIAVGFLISSVIDIGIIIAVVKKLTGVGFVQQLAVMWKSLLAGAIMAVIVYMMNLLPILFVWRLLLQVAAGVVLYGGISLLLKNEAFSQCISVLPRMRRK